uniref:Probable ATP-dependent transporter ycf16 n=1 Tax=Compsopogon caeruleus TaxID=31354 RepID=A0A7S1T954_9RHOD
MDEGWERTSGFWSRLWFSWVSPLLERGSERALQVEDLPGPAKEDRVAELSARFQRAWEEELHGPALPSLVRALFRADQNQFLYSAPIKFVYDLLHFVGPFALHGLLGYLSSSPADQGSIWRGLGYVALLFSSTSLQTLLLQSYFWRVQRSGHHIRAFLITAIYRKALRLSNMARNESTTGEMVNLIAVDSQNVGPNLLPFLHLVWSGPLQILLSLVALYRVLGIAALAGVMIMILLLPLNLYLARLERRFSDGLMEQKDRRTRLMNEVLLLVRHIKLFSWERRFREKIEEKREEEFKLLRSVEMTKALSAFVWQFTPVLVSISSFTVLVLRNGELALLPATVFSALALFNVLRFPLNVLPEVVADIIDAMVSARRIENFLLASENCGRLEDPASLHAAGFRRGNFYWEEVEPEVENEFEMETEGLLHSKPAGAVRKILCDPHIEFPAGKLIAVVGSVGTGKSSILCALLGQMVYEATDDSSAPAYLNGSVSYAPQVPWILSGTVRKNILFGDRLDWGRYEKVVSACALKQDLDAFPSGDLTEIGERGINLSGGQKARIALARAIYRAADTYLFDDPLSAVDAHVASHIFHEVMLGSLLQGKTRILVTHHIKYLARVDVVIRLLDGGTVEVESKETSLTSEEEEEHTFKSVETIPSSQTLYPRDTDESGATKLVAKEERLVGGVSRRVYEMYFGSMGLGAILMCLLFIVLNQAFRVFVDAWLSRWTDSTVVASQKNLHLKTGYFVTVYLLVALGSALFSVSWNMCAVLSSLIASRKLHNEMLFCVTRAPMAFFDSTPVGRILNRFAKDTDSLDRELPSAVKSFLSGFMNVCAAILVVLWAFSRSIIMIIPLVVIYRKVGEYFVRTSRELKRIFSLNLSPLLSHFGETVSGVNVIRAFDEEPSFIHDNEVLVANNMTPALLSIAANRWLSVRLEMLGNIFVVIAAVSATLNRGTMTPGLAGISITYALQVTSTLGWMIRAASNIETNMNNVERILQYISLEQEDEEVKEDSDPREGSWPSVGNVEFRDVVLKYRESQPAVLNQLSFTIEGGQKVGVCGRTGAGKSSLIMALFRMVELSSGQILLDGMNVRSLGLATLRKNITIISQDPALFSDTIRSNVDPFHEHSDSEIWEAIERVSLKELVSSLPLRLDTFVAEDGSNFSLGQRQLLCLSRALLRRSRIVVLDEATASLDFKTDEVVQLTIRQYFYDCTVICIAHRLQTILDSDHILVLDQGHLVEQGSPRSLLDDESSVFYGMARAQLAPQ